MQPEKNITKFKVLILITKSTLKHSLNSFAEIFKPTKYWPDAT